MLSLREYQDKLLQIFHSNSNPENKEPMEKYMRNHFPFLGIKTPERAAILKSFLQQEGKPQLEWMDQLAVFLYEQPEREFHYAALFFIELYIKKLDSGYLPLLEKLITTNSWWDTVDHIAPRLVGPIAAKDENVIKPFPDKWIRSDNFWLQRSAILFQLKYKQQTDEEKLFSYIQATKHSKEFFIQKAIGWALREYSKTEPEAALHFIKRTNLAPLSEREGLKHLKAKNLLPA